MAFSKNDMLKVKLERGVEAAKAQQAKLVEKLGGGLHEAEYQLRWMEQTYRTIYFGQLCEFALQDGLDKVLAFVEASLKSWRPERSTNPFSNACNEEKYEALTEFARDMAHFVEAA